MFFPVGRVRLPDHKAIRRLHFPTAFSPLFFWERWPPARITMLLTWLDVWGPHQPTCWERTLRANLSASRANLWSGLFPQIAPNWSILRAVKSLTQSLDSAVHLFPFSSFHLAPVSSAPPPLSSPPSFSTVSSCCFFSSPPLGLPTGWVVKSKRRLSVLCWVVCL